jgi:hypothetical protein
LPFVRVNLILVSLIYVNNAKERNRMFIQTTFKYLIAATLTVINFLGLYAINDLHENSDDLEPPSTLAVLATTPQIHDQISTKITSVTINKFESNIEPRNIQFKHGDVSWLPILASQAGWPQNTWPTLEKIILRESGGCPNRRGGDVVDANCKVKRVSTWSHRSDTGLLQINGINYDINRSRWASICLQMDVCTQKALLDPVTNLKAGKLLYDLAGWSPWDPCTWGKEWAHRCDPDFIGND